MKTTNEYKLNIPADNVLVMICLSAILGLAGCQQEGTAEKIGQKIDKATEHAEKKIEHVTEKAGKEIEGVKESVIDQSETAGEYIDDSVITLKVKAAILNDSLLKASQIEVNTVNGVVKLSGTVDSEQSLSRAMEVVNSQKHVKSVQTDLIVNTGIRSK